MGENQADGYELRESQGCTGCNPHFEIEESGCADYWKYYRTGQYSKLGNGTGDIL